MSYHYILNPFIRNKLEIIENNAIVILDEAHNICNIFESLFSKKIDNKSMEELQDSLQQILNDIDIFIIDKKEIESINEEINKLKNFIKKLKETKTMILNQNNNIINKDKSEDIYLCSLDDFKNLFFKKFSPQFYRKIDDIIKSTIEEKELKDDEIKKLSILQKPINKMHSFLSYLNQIREENILSYKFTLSVDENNGITFDIYCVDASIGMKNFLSLKPYSVILTSGTLSIDMLENLLQFKFYRTLENKHVINNDQFLMNIIEGDKEMNYYFYYNNRKNENQIMSLGNQIKNLAISVKIGGILVFFQSYDFLKTCHDFWLKSNIFEEKEINKSIIYDIKQKNKNVEKEIKKAKNKKNLLLFTVYRGKNSEGINFKDDEARMVICIGIPFPNISDLRVKLKRDFFFFLAEKYDNEYDSRKWYREEAYIAVNQALGRLIRHKNDYGIMICFGREFTNNSLFSEWIKPNKNIIRMKEDNGAYYKSLSDYLSKMKSIYINSDIINIEDSEDKKYDIDEFSEDEEENRDNSEQYHEDEQLYTEEKFIENENINIEDENEEIEENFSEENSDVNIIGRKRKRNNE